MENQQVAPLGLEDRDYSCQHSLAATAWTSAAQFSLSCSFMYLKSAACNKKCNSEGENSSKWSMEVLYEQIMDSWRETAVNTSAFVPIKASLRLYVLIPTYVIWPSLH